MRIKLVILIPIVFLFSYSCNSKRNTVYVNANRLLQNYVGSQIQHSIFQTKSQVWQQHLDSLNTELQVLGQVPAATRAAKEQQLLHYRDAIQQQAQQENQRMTKAVLEEINVYLKPYGKEKGYTFILGATENGNIGYVAQR